MYRDDSGISSLVIKCFGITNTSEQNFAIRISSVKTVLKCLRKLKVFWKKINIDVSSLLMSSLRVIVICQKYFGNHMISSQIHLSAPLLNMRRCTLWVLKPLYNSILLMKGWMKIGKGIINHPYKRDCKHMNPGIQATFEFRGKIETKEQQHLNRNLS